MLALPTHLLAADLTDQTNVVAGDEGAAPVLRPAAELRGLLGTRLRALFANPAQILEVGIRKPPKEVEKSRRELERFFHGAVLTRLDVAPAPIGSEARGRFGVVEVALERLTLMGLRLAEARFTLEDMRVDAHALAEAGRLDITGLGAIGMRFRVDEDALNAATEHFTLEVASGRFTVRGRQKLLILPVGYKAVGRLAFTDAGQIVFHDRSMHLNGLPLPGLFRRALRSRINPIFDLRSYLGVAAEVFRVEFQAIAHRPQALELHARAEVLVGEGPPATPPPATEEVPAESVAGDSAASP